MAEIQDWATTANGNDTGSPPDNAPEGFDPTKIDDVEREHQAVIRRWYGDISAVTTTSLSSNVITVTPNRTISSYFVGLRLTFKAPFNGNANTTIKIGSLAAKDILYPDGSNAAQDIVDDGFYDIVYDGTQFQLLSVGKTPNQSPTVRGRGNTTVTLESADINTILRLGTNTATVEIPSNPTFWPVGGRIRLLFPNASINRDLKLLGTQTLWRDWGTNATGTVQVTDTSARNVLLVRIASDTFGAFRGG